ncbi:hypothetical protein AAHE18_19G049900 [Arachis hypogaea]
MAEESFARIIITPKADGNIVLMSGMDHMQCDEDLVNVHDEDLASLPFGELGESSTGVELHSKGTPVQGSAANPCYPTQLIDGDNCKLFKVAETENFVKEMELDKCGQSYAVVSIIGPQSSGKSTLLNHLFCTNFQEMNADAGRNQTTKGIWIARCAGIEPCTLVLDVEGTDGKERGEQHDTSFERQSALFALAVSDVALINMWCHDIGRHTAANRPLLKTIFRVRMKLFTPRKITLLFVIRDKTKTPFEILKGLLLKDMEEIWKDFTTSKPDSHNEAALNDFFIVEVVALSSYEDKEEQFKEEVTILRQQICYSIVQDKPARDSVVPLSDFPYSSQEIWEKIKADKDLDLPSHKVMVATVRCEKIARDLAAKEEWHQFKKDMNCSTTEFVNRLSSQIVACLSEYDAETSYYDKGPRSTYKNQLKEKLLQLSEPALVSALEHIRSTILVEFKHTFKTALKQGEEFYAVASSCIELCLSNFDKACPVADVVIEMTNKCKIGVRRKLQLDIVLVVSSSYQEKLREVLSESIEKELFGGVIIDPWKSIREVLRTEVRPTVSQLSTALIGLGIGPYTRKMIENLEDYARSVVKEKVRGEAKNVQTRMKMCFESRFVNRLYIGNDDIPTAAKSARCYSLTLLSILAAIRLDDDDTDDIKEILEAELLDSSSSSAKRKRNNAKFDPLCLASDSWEQIPSCRKLIGPRSCKKVWDQFMHETEIIVSKALELGKSGFSKWSRIRKIAIISAATLFVSGGVTAAAILGPLGLLPLLPLI